MNVRRATPADAEAMARVHTASADAAYGPFVRIQPGGYERRLRVWRDVLGGDHCAYLAETDDGSAVGVLGVSATELDVIYVDPDWWGSGAGQLLLDRAHELLAATCDEAVLTVLAANARARRFYEREGWTPAGEGEPHDFDGTPVPFVRYRRIA